MRWDLPQKSGVRKSLWRIIQLDSHSWITNRSWLYWCSVVHPDLSIACGATAIDWRELRWYKQYPSLWKCVVATVLMSNRNQFCTHCSLRFGLSNLGLISQLKSYQIKTLWGEGFNMLYKEAANSYLRFALLVLKKIPLSWFYLLLRIKIVFFPALLHKLWLK